MQKYTPVTRPAVASDAADLILFADAASRRLSSWLWNQSADEGRSGLELARISAQTDEDAVDHYSKWVIAEHEGSVVGGLNSFVAPEIDLDAETSPAIAEVVQPLRELKRLATGSWYISTVSIFPEGQGRGLGTSLLNLAESQAREADINQVTLMVSSGNSGAHRLYERRGYDEWDRRPLVPFPGCDPDASWILMVKDLVPV